MARKLSRRKLLKASGLALAPQAASAQTSPGPTRSTTAGRKFRALVRYRDTASIQELRLLPIQPREVVIRTQASGVCYTIVSQVLSTSNVTRAQIPNHSAMGVVEEVGPLVKRVQPGDRVVIPGTPQCGQCYQCLQGRADWCQFLSTNPPHAMAEMADGTPVFEGGALGGLSELMVCTEEYCCPVFTDLPAEHLTMLGDTVGTGLAGGMNLAPIEPGSDVVVLGAGPVGIGAIQAARIKAAAQIIAVEPIRYRREIALKVGATLALDPNAEPDLVERIRELCKGRTDRRFAGGRAWGDDLFAVPRGPDFTIEAVGGDAFPPKVEQGPDPTGVLPLQQAWEFTRAGGHIVTLGFGQKGNVSFPAWQFANRGRAVHSGQQGGMNMLRDIPRYVTLMEKGVIDMKSVVTAIYPLDRAMEAVQAVADRTTMAAVVKF
jgi:S-(hydroxymethyl)glutathione dehydrogenase/alcohol dehydrogenase